MSLVNYFEVNKLNHDIDCLKYLINYINDNKMDSNIYYELVYYRLKFKHWVEIGIDEPMVLKEVNSLLNTLDIFFDSFTDDKINKMLKTNKHYLDLKSFDKLKYQNNAFFRGYVPVSRENTKFSCFCDLFQALIVILFIISVISYLSLNLYNGVSVMNETLSFLVICGFIAILYVFLIYLLGIISELKFHRTEFYYVRGYPANFYVRDRITRNILLLKYEFNSYNLEDNICLSKQFEMLAKVELSFTNFSTNRVKTLICSNEEDSLCMNLL